jgi:glucose/arabinose dehydrogenase
LRTLLAQTSHRSSFALSKYNPAVFFKTAASGKIEFLDPHPFVIYPAKYDMKRPIHLLVLLIIVVLTGLHTSATADEDQEPLWKDLDVPPTRPLKPQQALKSFRVPPGLNIELVAAEPMIADPVDIRWDAKGRMWVVEMRGFMPNVEGDGEKKPVGRISVLTDTNGDGVMDESTVFLDELVLPRTISFVEDGVLIISPPELLLAKDTNGDLKADGTMVIREDFASVKNVEHTTNGLRYGLDNWLYTAKNDKRYRYDDGKLIEEKTYFRGQWGISQDNYGRLYYNTNSSWLHADLLPGHYLKRNDKYETSRGVTERIVGDQSVHPIRINPGVNRAYKDNTLASDKRLGSTTAVNAPGIYRGDLFNGSLVGDAFVPEPAGNCVGHFAIEEQGLELDTTHKLYDDPEWGKREFIASRDERFRPVYARTGPDGALYIVDMYRGILQHRVYLSDYLKKYILHFNLHKPVGLGRIYRVVPEGSSPSYDLPALDQLAPSKLATYVKHPNGWVRDTTQRLIVQNELEEAVPTLRHIARTSDRPLARIHALWTLHGLGTVDPESVLSNIETDHPHVVQTAMRTGESLLGTNAAGQYVNALVESTSSEHQRIRVQAGLSLGEVSKNPLRGKAERSMLGLLKTYSDDKYVRAAILSGLDGRQEAFLTALEQHGLDDLHDTVSDELE